MKKILSILIITFLFIPNNVLALSANGSVKTTVENGSNVTFYVNINNICMRITSIKKARFLAFYIPVYVCKIL